MKQQILISSLILLSIQTLAAAVPRLVPKYYPTIQSAINASSGGDIVVVAPNPNPQYPVSYSGPGNVDLDFQGKAITVQSQINPANPNSVIIANTIIDCGGDRDNPHRAFWFHSGEGNNSKVLGFTIRNGYARGPKGADGAFGYDGDPSFGDPASLFRPIPRGDDPFESPPYALDGDPRSGNGHGGAILCAGASPTIQYCVISNCTVTGAQGGDGANGLWGEWDHWTISDFNTNASPWTVYPDAEMELDVPDGQWGGTGGSGSGNGYGGAIACLNGSSPIISDCTISDNFARGGCGGDGGNGGNAWEPPDYDEGDESFGGNGGTSTGDGIGGAIYADNGSNPIITNCIFSNNIATTGARAAGGQVGQGDTIPDNEGGPATDGASGLVYSSGGIAGGAAYYSHPSDANFTNCTFTGNKAYEAYVFFSPLLEMLGIEDIWRYTVGGALYSDMFNIVNLNTCDFTGNLGGAVYCDTGCTVNIHNTYDPNRYCLFMDNSETADGGALYIGPGCTVDLQNCIFAGNSAYDDGGALKCRSNATLTNCSFGGNRADSDNDDYGYGGAINAYEQGTILVVDFNSCGFTGNQAIYGGGFSSMDSSANFTDCYFIDNTAWEGGGLDLVNGELFVTGGAVKGNNATDGYGGGLMCGVTQTEIRNCTIMDNFAAGNGGAISFYGGFVTHLVKNCLITGNTSAAYGGGISCELWASPEIQNCTFSGNFADSLGGAIFTDWGSSSQITDCIFEGCNGHAIHEDGDATVTFSLFYDNPDGDYYDSGTGMTYSGPGDVGSIPGGSNNLYGDPLFVSGPLSNFYLNQASSPAIDNGSATALSLGLNTYTTDASNAPDSGQVDRGYHYRDITTVVQYQLSASVVGGHGSVAPTSGTYYAGTVVTLTAEPDAGWRVKAWSGTDDDSSTATTNSIIMNSDRTVTVEFEKPRTLIVAVGEPEYYSDIQDAVFDARDGDTIVVHAGTYYGGYLAQALVVDRSVLIRSLRPDDPCCVAETIIDGYLGMNPFTNVGVLFTSNTDADTVLNGFTIQNCGGRWGIIDGEPGTRDPINHPDGYDGPCGEGAAIFIEPGASPTVKNCVIRNNLVQGGDGGVGYAATGPPENLNAGRGGWGGFARGGAIYCGADSSPIFINCRIVDNTAIGGDGGNGGNGAYPGGEANYGGNWSRAGSLNSPVYYFDPCSSNIIPIIDGRHLWEVLQWDDAAYYALFYYPDYWDLFRTWFYGNYRWYSGCGGGAYCDIGSNVTFIDCEISGNMAQGGMSGQGGIMVPGDRFEEPVLPYEIPSFGGGVFCADGATVTFTGCTITDNISSPPVLVDPNDPDSGLRHRLDPYLGHGGGVCTENTATVIFTDCTFSENEAAVGGGLHFTDANPIISDCNFTSNSAFQGGGLFGQHGPATILHSNFTNNIASSDANDPNVLGEGGGLHFWATDVNIIDCDITSNQAEVSGGGVYFSGEGIPSLLNCLVTNNTAGRDGGGVSSSIFTSLTISNCTIADNTVTGVGFPNTFGGGLYVVSHESDVNVIDSIIWSNVATKGPQVAVGTGFEFNQPPSEVTVSYSDIGPRAGLIDFEAGGEPFWADWDQNDGAALIDAQNVYDQFGVDGWAEVIVSLFEPVELRKTTDWTSPESVAVLREEIDERQDSVLSTLTPAEFTLRHRFENQTGFSGEVKSSGLSKLLSNSLVAYIEPVRYVRPMLAQAIPLANALEARQVYDGTGIAVAIVDSGVDYTHPRLGNNGFPNTKVIGGYDTGDNDSDPMPVDEAHGTCCAGIAAGDLGTVGDYIGGVAYNATIYALKLTTDEGLWPTDSALDSWDWCVTHRNDDPDNPIKVMSNSWGSIESYTSPSAAEAAYPALTIAADTVVAAGITLLASSGNEYQIDAICAPAAFSSVISVGAVDDVADTVMDYSNTADFLDILAPADPIYTTDIVGSAGYDVGDYFPGFNGTSAACPFAAGAIASLQSAAMAEWGRYLTPEEVRTVLVVTGAPVTDTKVNITKPRVNLAAAISYLTAPPIYVEDGCTFIGWDPNAVNVGDWDPNFSEYANISENPLFVDGYLLSQTEAGQEEDSNCVDAGSDLAINLGLNTYTTRTDRIFDKGFVDMGYHYPLALAESCRISDLFPDGVIDFKDFVVFAQFWLADDCSPDNNWCAGADLTFDTYVNQDDLVLFAKCWLVEDTDPPLPNPSEWEIEPYSTSTTPPYPISMTAKTAVDAWGFDVEYYFECVTDGDFNSPDWQSSSTYEANGFTKDIEYGFKVRARDTRPVIPDDGTGEQGNKTEWSVIRYAIAGEEIIIEDHNAPIPDPMTWETEPYATSPTSIAMVATTAIDDTAGVEYYFEDFDFPGVNSGWIGVPTWTTVGLIPNTTYTYRVMARDTSPWWNETGWSDPCSATTPEEPNEPEEDTNPPAPVVWEVPPYQTGSGNNCYAHMTAAEAIDPEGNGPVEYYFECTSPVSFNSGWMEERVWNNISIGRGAIGFHFRFKVRDNAVPLRNESAWSTTVVCYPP